MLAQKLTVTLVSNAPITSKDYVIMDTEVGGFALKVTAQGHKSYSYQYRLRGRGHTTRRFKIGDASERFPPHKARIQAEALRVKVRQGIDPQAERRKQSHERLRSAAQTFGKLINDYYEQRLKQNRCGLKVKRTMERDFKNLLPRPVNEIERADISAIVHKIYDRGAEYSANRSLSFIKTFFRWSMSCGYVQGDPTSGMQKPFSGETARDRVLSPVEIKALWNEFTQLGRPFGDAHKVLLQTAQRRDEVSRMRWEDLDFENSLWTIPRDFTKNKQPHQVPLTTELLAIIRAQPRLGPFVFTSTGAAPISGWSKAKRQIDNSLKLKKKTISNWRIHDLRRTVASNLGDLGYNDSHIGLLLNHQNRGVTAIYNRSTHMMQKKEMLEKWQLSLCRVLQSD